MLERLFFGRSDRIRTCGIDVPNVARYQLRHTPKCVKYSIFAISRKWSNLWSKHFVGAFLKRGTLEKSQCFQGFSGFLKTCDEKPPARSQASALPAALHPDIQCLYLLHSYEKTCAINSTDVAILRCNRTKNDRISVSAKNRHFIPIDT